MTEVRGKKDPEGESRQERLEIGAIAAGGEGVGRLPDGRAIFVHRTAPGESVEVAVIEERGRWARGRLLRVLEPAADRRIAPCPHYARCGGCTLEHLEYPAQLAAKAQIVADAITRIGGVPTPPPEIEPSPQQFRYRNRLTFALRRLGSGRVVAGFHGLHEPGRIVPIDGTCLLPEQPIALVWDRLRAAWGPDARSLPAGERLRLTLRATSDGAVSLLVEGGFTRGRPEELLEAVNGLAAIWHRPKSGTVTLLAGVQNLPERWGEERFELGATAFLQVNRQAAELLEEHVVELAGDVEGRTVIDAYCGIGLHARRLARAGASVVGLELDADAVRIATEATAELDARFLEGRVEDLLATVLPADLLILNPPRTGVDPIALEAILADPPERIIYISCNPATLARDLKRMVEIFNLAGLRSFDLFPQTAHVETVVDLHRRG